MCLQYVGVVRNRSSRHRSRVQQLSEGHMTSGSEFTDSEDEQDPSVRNVLHVVSACQFSLLCIEYYFYQYTCIFEDYTNLLVLSLVLAYGKAANIKEDQICNVFSQDSDSGLQYTTPTQSLTALSLQARRSREAMMRTNSMESLPPEGRMISFVLFKNFTSEMKQPTS